MLSGIFLVVAKGIGSIEVLVDSFFPWGIAYVCGPCGIFLFLGFPQGCWQHDHVGRLSLNLEEEKQTLNRRRF